MHNFNIITGGAYPPFIYKDLINYNNKKDMFEREDIDKKTTHIPINEIHIFLSNRCRIGDGKVVYIYDGQEVVGNSRLIIYRLHGYDFSEILSKIDMSQIESFEFHNLSQRVKDYDRNSVNPF